MEISEEKSPQIAGLESALSGLPFRQRQYLSVLAMRGDEILARRLSNNDAKVVENWRTDTVFANREAVIQASEGQWKTDGFALWLDDELPEVLSELVNIVHMEPDNAKALAVKEKAVEFFLKELCGLTKNIRKSVSFDKLILGLMEQEGGD